VVLLPSSFLAERVEMGMGMGGVLLLQLQLSF
jgi:hypothetical protein